MSKRTALLFSGQGAQHVGMGKDLAEHSSLIKHMYQQADRTLEMDLSLTCFTGPVEKLTKTSYCQPALFVHGLALLKLLEERVPNLQFEATAGLSLGEFTAHTAAGTFSFEDGLRLVAERGRLMQVACESTHGTMVSLIGATNEQAEKIAQQSDMDVANYNCPGQIVLSGAKEKVPQALEHSKTAGIKKALPLNVAGAYHSRLMQSAQDALTPFLHGITLNDPKVRVTANVTGDFVQGQNAIRDTLLRQVTGSVRWEQCVRALIQSGIERFIELGPGKVLAGLCKRIEPDVPCISIGNLNELESACYELK